MRYGEPRARGKKLPFKEAELLVRKKELMMRSGEFPMSLSTSNEREKTSGEKM